MNNHFKIILAGCLIFTMLTAIPGSTPAASQSLREAQNEISDNIRITENKLLDIENKIKSQLAETDRLEKIIDEKKEQLRKVKESVIGNPSFNAVTWIEAAEKEVKTAETNFYNARNILFSYYDQRSNILTEIKNLKELFAKLPRETAAYYPKHKLLGIQLSESCQLVDTCPTYADMIPLDSSLQNVSGVFVDGIRTEPNYQQSWRYYDIDPTPRIFVDPPKGMSERIRMITIVPSLDDYFIRGDMSNGTHRTVYHDRYIDKCRDAVISADVWLTVLPITIHDLRNGCINSEFDEQEIIPFPKNEIDITTSPNWQYEQKLKADKIKCKGKCFEY